MLYKAIKALIIFVSCFILVTPSFAAYISVTPTEFNLNLNPSQFYNGTININNTCQDQLQINISSELEGTYSGNEAGISLDDNNFTLNPGETKKVNFTVKAPNEIDFSNTKYVLIVNSTSNTINNSDNINVPISISGNIKSNLKDSNGLENDTNNTNDTIAIEAIWNGNGDNPIDFGNLSANDVQMTFVGGSSGEQIINYSNVTISLLTKASGPFTNGDNVIPINNLLYSDYGGNVNSDTPLSTDYNVVIANWEEPSQGSTDTADVTYKLTVPWNTPSGIYSTTIYHLAMAT